MRSQIPQNPFTKPLSLTIKKFPKTPLHLQIAHIFNKKSLHPETTETILNY